MIWAGLFVSSAAVFSFGVGALFLLFAPLPASIEGQSHSTFFLPWLLLLVVLGVIGVFFSVQNFRQLRGDFTSGEIVLERLLPFAGAILWLFGLIGVVIWIITL